MSAHVVVTDEELAAAAIDMWIDEQLAAFDVRCREEDELFAMLDVQYPAGESYRNLSDAIGE